MRGKWASIFKENLAFVGDNRKVNLHRVKIGVIEMQELLAMFVFYPEYVRTAIVNILHVHCTYTSKFRSICTA